MKDKTPKPSSICLVLSALLAISLMHGSLAGLMSTVCFGQPSLRQPDTIATLEASYKKLALEEWSGNAQPYRAIRKQIDDLIAGGQRPEILMKNHETKAFRNPADSQAQFRWGYAAYKAAIMSGDLASRNAVAHASQSLAKAAPNKANYEYSRLRFLLENFGPYKSFLKELGERLVRYNPNDYDVKYFLATILNNSQLLSDHQQALLYAQELVGIKPAKATAWALLGEVYEASWYRHKRQSDAQKAIEAYNRFLATSPTDTPFRKIAPHRIKQLKKAVEKQ